MREVKRKPKILRKNPDIRKTGTLSHIITNKPVTQKTEDRRKPHPACPGSPGQRGIFSELTPCRKGWDSDK
jgi:hypothetical protein